MASKAKKNENRWGINKRKMVTSDGKSSNSRPKNKHKRRMRKKKYRGQGKG